MGNTAWTATASSGSLVAAKDLAGEQTINPKTNTTSPASRIREVMGLSLGVMCRVQDGSTRLGHCMETTVDRCGGEGRGQRRCWNNT